MGVTVNSFLFGSLLTSAKMTALQDTVVHIMSNFILDHNFDFSTEAGSHNNNVVNNEHAQTITGSKAFAQDAHFRKALEVRSYMAVGSGTSNAHIKLHSNIGGAESNYIGYDSSQDSDGLFLVTNQLRSQVQDNDAEGSWELGIGFISKMAFRFKPPGGSFKTVFSTNTTGVVSAFHIPRAGQAFGGLRVVGNTTISANVNWEDVPGVSPSGHLHCENFKLNNGITITSSNNVVVQIHAVGSITIDGILDGCGADGAISGGGGAAGETGVYGGAGGGGGGSSSGGGDGGATLLTNGGIAGSGPNDTGGTGTDVSTIFRYLIDKTNVISVQNLGEFGGEGGFGGWSGGDSGGEGGHGGNMIYLEAPMIRLNASGELLTTGGNGLSVGGSDAGGGGGGGGIVIVYGRDITIVGTINVVGGVGGTGDATGGDGGPGGDGLIIFKGTL